MKVRFQNKKRNGEIYHRFKISEHEQVHRLSKSFDRYQSGAVKVCIMDNGVRVGYDKDGEVVWSF